MGLIWFSWTDTLLFISGFFCSVASGVVEVFIPFCQANIVNTVVKLNGDDDDEMQASFKQLSIYVGCLMVAKSLLILLRSSFLSRSKDRLELKIQSVLFNKM